MTQENKLIKFWGEEHIRDSGWLTGTSWANMQQYYSISKQDVHNKACLEIGVGKLTVTRELAQLATPLYCCDISEAALAKTKDLALQSYLTQDLAEIPSVDIVLCHLVLVHCDDQECVRILKSINLNPQGRIFCQFSSFKDQKIGVSDASEHTQQLLDVGNKHWFRTTEQIQNIVTAAGLRIHSMKEHWPGDFYGWNGQLWQFLELRELNT